METEDDLCQNTWGASSSKSQDPVPSILDYELDTEPNQNITWDPRTMLSNLSFMEQKIHQLQDLVHLILARGGPLQDDLVAQQQITSLIIQLISTAGSLLPSVNHNMSTPQPGLYSGQSGQPGQQSWHSGQPGQQSWHSGQQSWHSGQQSGHSGQLCSSTFLNPSEPNNVAPRSHNDNNCSSVPEFEIESHVMEEHETKDEDDAEEGEHLAPGSYEILQLEKEEIIAPHIHFCTVCGKGFKRDANLRMHMRGHGDEYKTPEALTKPNIESVSGSVPVLIKRYSCPFLGCKRNKDHKKFQPLKTILCVKNHYKRTHCDKSFTCGRCHAKKFSVVADLKTHEKHCGKSKWLCSCGTTFSRKDKLFGHVALFQGHTPAIPLEETKHSGGSSAQIGSSEFNIGSSSNANSGAAQPGIMEGRMSFEGFSPLSFDTSSFEGLPEFPEFPRPMFDDSESSLQMFIASACGFSSPRNGDGSLSNTSL